MTSCAPKLKEKNLKKRARDKLPKPNAWAVALEQYFLNKRVPARAKQQLLESIEKTLDAPGAGPMHYTVEERDKIFDAHDIGLKWVGFSLFFCVVWLLVHLIFFSSLNCSLANTQPTNRS